MKNMLRLAIVLLVCSVVTTACGTVNEDNRSSLSTPPKQHMRSPVPTLATTAVDTTPEIAVYGRNESSAVLRNPSDEIHIESNVVRGLSWSPVEDQLAVYGPQGIWLYTLDQLTETPRLLPVHTSLTPPAFSMDGHLLAAIDANGDIKIWDTITGEPIVTLDNSASIWHGLTISPDNQTLAMLGDARIYIWDIPSGEQQDSLPLPDKRIFDLAFNENGVLQAAGNSDDIYITVEDTDPSWVYILPGGDAPPPEAFSSQPTSYRMLDPTVREIHIWNATTGESLNSLDGLPGAIMKARFEGYDNLVMRLEPSDNQETPTGSDLNWNIKAGDYTSFNGVAHRQGIPYAISPENHLWATLEAMPGGKALIEIHDIGSEHIWQIEDTAVLSADYPMETQAGILPVEIAFSPEGSYLTAWNMYGVVSLYDVALAQQLATLDDFRSPVTRLAISPDSTSLAVGDTTGRISIFDLESGRQTNVFQGHTGSITELVYSPNRDLLFSLDNNQNTWLWNTVAEAGERVEIPAVSPSMETSIDGRHMTWAFSDRSSTVVRLWTPEDEGLGKYIFASHHIHSINFSPNGQWLASGGQDGAITVWDPVTRDSVMMLTGHLGAVTGLLFSQDALRLISWSIDDPLFNNLTYDRTVRVWDLETGENIYVLDMGSERFSAIDIDSDGSRLALASYEEPIVRVWDMNRNTIIANLMGEARITCLEFASDRPLLISGSIDGVVSLWFLNQ